MYIFLISLNEFLFTCFFYFYRNSGNDNVFTPDWRTWCCIVQSKVKSETMWKLNTVHTSHFPVLDWHQDLHHCHCTQLHCLIAPNSKLHQRRFLLECQFNRFMEQDLDFVFFRAPLITFWSLRSGMVILFFPQIFYWYFGLNNIDDDEKNNENQKKAFKIYIQKIGISHVYELKICLVTRCRTQRIIFENIWNLPIILDRPQGVLW